MDSPVFGLAKVGVFFLKALRAITHIYQQAEAVFVGVCAHPQYHAPNACLTAGMGVKHELYL